MFIFKRMVLPNLLVSLGPANFNGLPRNRCRSSRYGASSGDTREYVLPLLPALATRPRGGGREDRGKRKSKKGEGELEEKMGASDWKLGEGKEGREKWGGRRREGGRRGGPTYSVYKQLGLCREVIVHDIVKHWDINASCLETR